MKISTFFAFFFLLVFSAGAQVAPDKYYVSFTDKNGTPYSINNPQAFLSQRAIDRRIAQGIPIDETDLPVNPEYVNAVKNTGVQILNVTKWLNGVTFYTTDPSRVALIEALPFVSGVMKNSGPFDPGFIELVDKFRLENQVTAPAINTRSAQDGYNYGQSFNQIHMLRGDIMHNNGHRGQGKVIAVLDAGFKNADVLPVFDSLRNEGRLLGAKDFVQAGGNVYDPWIAAHGTMVLSTMAGNLPGQLIGTAPKASYWLLRSEDDVTEYIIEEYNWVTAAEFADSAGADIINSSLGYTTFFEPTYDHSCADMDGNTTPVTRGANIAASKGIAVINSAGNSGGSGWTCVGAPSDGDNVIAVGAVDPSGNYAFFSSVGVDTAGRVKPNVAAQGQSVFVSSGEGGVITSNGTSFASPIIAGMVACLWQAQPGRTNTEILSTMQRSASHYDDPDSLTGYGIPDFVQALMFLDTPDISGSAGGTIYPNPFHEAFTVEILNVPSGETHATVTLTDILGKRAGEWKTSATGGRNFFRISPAAGLAAGVYLVTVRGENMYYSFRIVKR